MDPRSGKLLTVGIALLAIGMTVFNGAIGSYGCAVVSAALVLASGMAYQTWDRIATLQTQLDRTKERHERRL